LHSQPANNARPQVSGIHAGYAVAREGLGDLTDGPSASGVQTRWRPLESRNIPISGNDSQDFDSIVDLAVEDHITSRDACSSSFAAISLFDPNVDLLSELLT
jgi:hypothetical protein